MFNNNQRRYLGNKHKLNNFINTSIKKSKIKYNTFMDLFAGSGSVGYEQLKLGKEVSFNDFLYSNFVSYEGFSGKGMFSLKKLQKIILNWNELSIETDNYFSLNFGNKYFEVSDARKLGFLREELEIMKKNRKVNKREYYILLTSLIYSMDRIANTVGHYDAFRDITDRKSELEIKLINTKKEVTKNYNQDANIISRNIDSDVVYIDPPYNSRQYGDAYHLLENYAKWEKPKTFGKAAKMNRHDIKSEYSMKNAIIAFETLINSLNTKYILVSYNDTGLTSSGRSAAKMSDKDIMKILKTRGKVTVYKQEYAAFNTGKTERKKVYERLFICEINKPPTYKQNLKSPLNYVGGKYSLISKIKDKLPENINTFYDIFAGALNVGVNSGSNKVVANEMQNELVEILNFIKETPTALLINNIEKYIKKYNLSHTAKYSYVHYHTNSSDGLAKFNKTSFLRLRDDYNKTKKVELLLMLVIYGFNNMIRFNKSGEFNTPVGKRDFNNNIRANMISFSERLKDIVINIKQGTYLSINPNKLKRNDFVFMDPPYWITKAVYNNSWFEKDEIKLCNYIRHLDDLGIKFMLTNALSNGDLKNEHLLNLIEERNLEVTITKNNFSNSSYNKKEANKVVEGIITNYKK
ncbi:MAG: Dam family site-specific DNA-(adenine-N6)-methyltransferase [Mycoplasmatales bacterium]|nr:Dam family site-specific DNA-(adenine-N6)-methyltransferase [Mycoplasmatales bacterium]